MSINDKLGQYLPAIDISEPLRTRIGSICNIMTQVCPDSIEDVFVSELIAPDGTRQYQSIFFFSPLYMIEAKQFLAQDSFDITPLKRRVYYFELYASGYDFERSNPTSRLNVTVILNEGIRALLQASGVNCNFLKDIILKYFKENLVK